MEPSAGASSGGDLSPRSRRNTYFLLSGIVVGTLLTGLALPFAVGERSAETVAAGAGASGDGQAARGARGGAVTAPAGPAAAPGDAVVTADEAIAPPVAGSSASPQAPPATPTEPGGPSGQRLAATDQGVSPTAVKVGFLLLSLGKLDDVGVNVPGVDPEQQQEAFEGYIAEINSRGGLNGRTLVGAYRTYDPLNKDSQRAACLALARDERVFAVIAPGGYTGAAQLCVTREHGIPLFAADPTTPSEFYVQSRGLLFTMFPSGNRMMANWAAELHRLGLLRGTKVGLLGDAGTDPAGKTQEALAQALAGHGYAPVHGSHLSADLSTGASQIPIEVQQMRSKGVDALLIATNTIYATQFAQAADNQGWRPAWFVTDWSGGTNDPFGERMPASFDGAVGITTKRQGETRQPGTFPTPAPERECRDAYAKATGRQLEPGSSEDGLTLQNCALVRAFAAGAIAAGADLTRARLSAATQSLPPFAVPVWAGGAFRPGKFDFADLVRTVQFRSACRCWLPKDAFRAPAH